MIVLPEYAYINIHDKVSSSVTRDEIALYTFILTLFTCSDRDR